MAPPPLTPGQAVTRRNVIFAFWVHDSLDYAADKQAVIFLGIPLWWKTTNIYRAKLPLELMDEWSDGKVTFSTSGGLEAELKRRHARSSFQYPLPCSL